MSSNRCSTTVRHCCHGRRHDTWTRRTFPRRAGSRLRRRRAGGAARPVVRRRRGRRRGPALLGPGPSGGHRHLARPARGVAPARRLVAGPGGLHGDRPARPRAGRVLVARRTTRATLITIGRGTGGLWRKGPIHVPDGEAMTTPNDGPTLDDVLQPEENVTRDRT